MDPAASSAPTWRRGSSRRRSLAPTWCRRRADELEAAVARLRGEKEAAERAAAALRAELEAERGAAATAASEAMTMIARLQREKAAAMIEARAFRRVAEGRACRDRELQDQLAVAAGLAASYQALLRAHGIDPDDDEDDDDGEYGKEEEDVDSRGGETEAKGVVVAEKPSPSPSPPSVEEEFEYKYAVDVRCAAVTKAAVVAEERAVAGADVARALCARVEALEADSAAMRREVAALRADRAQVAVLAREVARRLCREAATARAAVVVTTAEGQRFTVPAIFKWFFSTILWGTNRSACEARRLPNPLGSCTTHFLLGLLPLLERSKATQRIRSKMAGNGRLRLPCCERSWCTPL
ncbi:hypothetical protein EJB05_15018, partial [Eragrostis curvula]